ncbi:MAG: hypothetical protein R2819_11825 [Allomuricauda sp.]
MTSFFPKRIAIYISLVLTIGILAPSGLKLAHALHGHNKEKRCVAYGTDHIHSADVHCDFHDFTLASNVFFASSFAYTPLEAPSFDCPNTFYTSLFKPYKTAYLALRGPPQVS